MLKFKKRGIKVSAFTWIRNHHHATKKNQINLIHFQNTTIKNNVFSKPLCCPKMKISGKRAKNLLEFNH